MYRKFRRSNTLWYAALTETTVVLMVIGSLLQDVPQKATAFKTWLPWDYSTGIGYWTVYMHQMIAHGSGATINVACDSLVAGFMVQTCTQFNILKQRFLAMPNFIEKSLKSYNKKNVKLAEIEYVESKILSRYIKHHLEILNFAKTLNNLFDEIVFLQFSISTLVLCVSVYQLSTLNLFTTEFASIILYLLCMLIQVFFLCYYGSEITLEVKNWNTYVTKKYWLYDAFVSLQLFLEF